jgi:hypothetical protein
MQCPKVVYAGNALVMGTIASDVMNKHCQTVKKKIGFKLEVGHRLAISPCIMPACYKMLQIILNLDRLFGTM